MSFLSQLVKKYGDFVYYSFYTPSAGGESFYAYLQWVGDIDSL